MHLIRRLGKSLLVVALLLAAPLSSFAQFSINIGVEPPPLPYYEQPPCPVDGYLWTPGYWGYGDYGYYWIPGVWIRPPGFGLLWTPPYWGYGDGGGYFFHTGYWGPHVGFYGGINYGYGYGGNGYGGGRWNGNHFFYNTSVNRVNVTNIHNTYVDSTVVNNYHGGTSFNGGANGVHAQPTAEDQRFQSEHHVQPTADQQEHFHAASMDRGQLASVNHGKPATLAAPRASAYKSVAQRNEHSHPLSAQDKVQGGNGREVKHQADTHTGEVHQGETHPADVHTGETHPTESTGESHKAVTHEMTDKPETHQASVHSSSEPAQVHHEKHMDAGVQHQHTQGGGQPHPQGQGAPHQGQGGQGNGKKDKKNG